MRLRGITAAAAAATALLLAGCGGSAGSDEPGPGGPSGTASSGAPAKTAHAPEQALPDGFDAAGGWAVRSDEGLHDPVIDARAGAVAFLADEPGASDFRVRVRDLKTGAVRWSSSPLRPLDTAQSGMSFTPRLLVAAKDGKDYVAVLASGGVGGDGVDKPSSVMRLTVFALDSSGAAAAPLRTVDVPAQDLSVADFRAQDDGRVVVPRSKGGVAVDIVSGAVTTYTADQLKAPANAPGCRDSLADCDLLPHLVGVSGDGALVNGEDAFWRTGGAGWFSAAARPPQADAEYGSAEITAVTGGRVLARWEAQNGLAFPSVVSVSDLASGALTASVLCTGGRDTNVRTSADGRYLAAGTAVFDLRQNKGYCFAETPQHNALTVQSVDDAHGIAYAMTDGKTPARITLADGRTEALPQGTAIPRDVAAGMGMFTDNQPEGFSAAFYPVR
ncbi:hypothetical protein GCM10023205_27480 [Yinghuangia aomiensis]|uniref:PQQ-like domain-containing protein n=1 Tax=Yinghuangia aomiensis TaxID=676205 RepID=A0ABP9H4X8_9ACTN